MTPLVVAYGSLALGTGIGFILAGLFRSAKVADLQAEIAEMSESAEHDARLMRDFATRLRTFERADKERRRMLSEAGKKGRAAQLGGK